MKASTLAAAFALASLGAEARADAPPGDGLRFVPFHFKVENAPTTDWTLVAWPCSTSSGAPVDTYAEDLAGGVDVGRRGGPCNIYAVKPTTWRAFVSSRPKAVEPDAPSVLAAFFGSSPDVRRCDLAPELHFTLPEGDPRSRIEETLRVLSLSDAGCKLSREAARGPAASEPRASRRGCGGCSATPSQPAPAVFVALLTAAAVLRRKRPG